MTGYQLYAKINCTLKAVVWTWWTAARSAQPPGGRAAGAGHHERRGRHRPHAHLPDQPRRNHVHPRVGAGEQRRALVPQTRLLGMCPAPQDGSADITALYTAATAHWPSATVCSSRRTRWPRAGKARSWSSPRWFLPRHSLTRPTRVQQLAGRVWVTFATQFPIPKMKISPPNTPDDRKKLEAELLHRHSKSLLSLSVLSFIVVATVGLLALCSCAHTEKGLQRENYLHDAASNAITTLQPVVQAAPAPVNAILGSVFAGLSGLLALWATHIQRSVKDLQKGNGGGNSDLQPPVSDFPGA